MIDKEIVSKMIKTIATVAAASVTAATSETAQVTVSAARPASNTRTWWTPLLPPPRDLWIKQWRPNNITTTGEKIPSTG